MRKKKFKPETIKVTILPDGIRVQEVNSLVYPQALGNPLYYHQRKAFKDKEDSLRIFAIDTIIMPNGKYVSIDNVNLKEEVGKIYKGITLENGKIQIQ